MAKIRLITTLRVLHVCTLDYADSLISSELQQTFSGKREFVLRVDGMHKWIKYIEMHQLPHASFAINLD